MSARSVARRRPGVETACRRSIGYSTQIASTRRQWSGQFVIGILSCTLAATLLVPHSARSQTGAPLRGNSPEPVAIVEEISPSVPGLQRLDLVSAGRVAELGADGRMVLGYLKSCWQDSIAGGRAIVEPLKSLVEKGLLARRRVECDAAGLARMTSDASARGGSALSASALPEPDINLYGLSPIVISAETGSLVIERLDGPAPPVKIELAEKKIDLQEKNVALSASGLYRFTRGNTALIVRIDGFAEAGRAPAAGRLVIFR